MKVKGLCLFFSLFLIFHNYLFAGNDSLTSELTSKDHDYSLHDIKAGERIFYGMVPSAKETINCASCHNTNHIDTLNWNPSALAIAFKYKDKDFASFRSAITEPTGKVMTEIHEKLDLSDEQIHQVRGYLFNLAEEGKYPIKPLRTKRIIFIVLLLLFFATLADMIVIHRIKYRIVHISVLGVTLLFITNYIARSAIDLGRSPDYQPDQPIKFSHKVHAGQNETSCLYCHFNAEQSKFAGIPPANVCTNCHVIVREGTRSGKFEINKIYDALENKEPIKWVKVHNLPDHVYFNHAQHVVAGKIDCMECHGDVASMDEIVQVNDLSMGWCVECHRETGVQFDNRFYGKYEKLHKDLKEGKIDKVTVEQMGGIDCMKCHY